MDLKKLRTFQAVADCLNLTKAADLLGYTQPTITVQLQSLESELGIVLFKRVGKKTFLTPSGKIVKRYADQAIAQFDEMNAELQQERQPQGMLTIAAPEFYCTHYLSRIIHSYISQNPEVKLQLFSCDSKESMKKVVASEADLAIVAGPIRSSSLEHIFLGREDLILVTTPKLFAEHEPKELFERYPFITYKSGSNLQSLMNACMEEYGIRPAHFIECVSDETIRRTVLYETGTALLGSALVEGEIRDGTLAELHRFPGKIETSMIMLKSRLEEPNIRSFAGIARAVWQQAEPLPAASIPPTHM